MPAFRAQAFDPRPLLRGFKGCFDMTNILPVIPSRERRFALIALCAGGGDG